MEQTIGVTGAYGFIGTHASLYLHNIEGFNLLKAGREIFSSDENLFAFASQCDQIIHLAGENRGDDEILKKNNILVTKKLVSAVEKNNTTKKIIFSSSTQINQENAYSDSKLKCAEILSDWEARNNTAFINLVIPNVYGEWCKPFYNSVVATFCHLFSTGNNPEVQQDKLIDFIYIQDLIEIFHNALLGKQVEKITGSQLTVSELYQKIKSICERHKSISPLLYRDNVDNNLSSTYHSYIFPQAYPISIDHDEFMERVEFSGLTTRSVTISTNENTVSLEQGLSVMNHIFVREGEVAVKIRRIDSEESREFLLNANMKNYLEVPKYHNIEFMNIHHSDVEIFIVNQH